MSVTPPSTPAGNKTPVWLFFLICLLLTGNFLYRLLVTASEYPPRSMQVIGMIIDAGLIIGLFGTGNRSHPLFWIALVAGIGLFAIRLHSDASWWTGHWHYNIYAR
jgi:hypothetical protein